jgi:hypothetical protein
MSTASLLFYTRWMFCRVLIASQHDLSTYIACPCFSVISLSLACSADLCLLRHPIVLMPCYGFPLLLVCFQDPVRVKAAANQNAPSLCRALLPLGQFCLQQHTG